MKSQVKKMKKTSFEKSSSPVKKLTSKETMSPKNTKKPEQVMSKGKKKNQSSHLLTEIKALGGDETDMDLLKAVLNESDDEFVEESNKTKLDVKSLMKDLKSFMKNTLDLNPTVSQVEEVESDAEEDTTKEDENTSPPKEMTEQEKQVSLELQQMLQGKKNTSKDDNSEEEEDDMPHFGKVIVEPIQHWYTTELEKVEKRIPVVPGSQEVESLLSKAKNLWDQDIRAYDSIKKPGSTSADKDFIATVLKSGTVTDKVSALTLLVQESPVHAFPLLSNQLVNGMARKKARREALLAIDSIKDLAIGCLLPDRKLKFFVDQPLFEKSVTSAHLISWCFENELKKLYFDYVSILEEMSKDPLPHIKLKVIAIIYDLLASKPEQEQNLLALLVNKLGDQDRKVASKATYLLSQLVIRHPAMKSIVIKEVERLLYRQNMGIRAQYYAVTFMNQIVLTKKESDVEAASQLIQIYFSLFEILVKRLEGDHVVQDADTGNKKDKKNGKKGKAKPAAPTQKPLEGIDAKMMAALLTGVNRAFPFAKLDHDVFESQINMLFKIVHVGSFNTAIQALNLLFHVQAGRESITDRFYSALYTSLQDNRLFSSSKQAMFLNLLFKALKEDAVMNRQMAFVKRIVQMCAHAQVPLMCAALFLVGELAKSKPALWSMILQAEEDEDDEEHFEDAPFGEDEDTTSSDIKEKKEAESEDEDKVELVEEEEPQTSATKTSQSQSYDPRKRDPRFANAQKTCLWELNQLTTHFHPTVALYARTLISGSPITVPPGAKNYDPLQNHTLSRFLDRFLYKAPKKLKNLHHGSSLMQPRTPGLSNSGGEDQLVAGGRKKRNAVYQDQNDQRMVPLEDTPVNLVDWNTKDEKSVPVDEVFFYHFFKEQQKKTGVPVDPNSEIAKDMDDVDSDQEIPEDEVWEAMQRASGFPKMDDVSDEEPDLDLDMDMGDAFEEGSGLDAGGEEGWETDDDDAELGSDDDDNDDMLMWAQEADGVKELEDLSSDEEGQELPSDLSEDDTHDAIGEEDDAEDLKFMIEDEGDSELEEEEDDTSVSQSKKGKKKKVSKAAERLNQKAAVLGYKGDFFKRSSMNHSYMSAFADADEFEAVLEAAEASNEDEDGAPRSTATSRQPKRKREDESRVEEVGKKSTNSKSKKHRKHR